MATFLTLDFLASAPECREWILRAEALGFQSGAAPGGASSMGSVRNNAQAIDANPGQADDLWSRILPRLPRGSNWIGVNARLRYYRYRPGQFFDWHSDAPFRRPGGFETSTATLLLYLNEDFEGGETEFADGSVVCPRRGTGLIFDHRLRHCGAPVRMGTKYLLRSDLMATASG